MKKAIPDDHSSEIEPRLKWGKTWKDSDTAYSAFDERYQSGEIGRLFLQQTGPKKDQWFWCLTAFGNGLKRPSADRGFTNTAREAGASVEKAWLEAFGT